MEIVVISGGFWGSSVGEVYAKMVTETPLANQSNQFIAQYLGSNDDVQVMSKVSYTSAVGYFDGQQRIFSVVRLADGDYTGGLDDRRLATGYVVERPNCWKSRVQSQGALVTTGLKNLAEAKVVKVALWFRGSFKELGVQLGGVPITMVKFKRGLDLVYVSRR
ncbi:uncharacterized protein LOC131156018 [Malania oleifera]|uniref:uncharacterized protein LOC131156018 n=1 Tax=Malania oleifera TaxID=397392 RepID=UPI0025AECBC6|nr:uncharacterized protein LOC131156018 [Malania oleifera]